MKHCKYFFIVYAIAMLSSVGANAATVTGLATPEYVKGAINSLPAVARSGSYNDLSNKPTLGAMAAKSNVTNADISGTINQDKITGLTGALAGKQPTLTTGDTGNIKGAGSVTVTKDASTGVITVSGTDTIYTLPAANGSTRGGVVTGGDITATSGTLTITDGKVTSAKIADGTIVNADISGSAAIATSKISGLDTALAAKQTTANLVKAVADMTDGNRESTTMYPSMKVAQQIAMEVTSGDITELQGDVEGLQTDLDNLKGTVNANKTAAENAIKALDSSVANANGAISTITITDGKITNVTRKSVATADIADGAVDGKKIKDGAIAAGNNISVTKDTTTGVVTVANTYSYTLPAANGSTRGGVVTGGDITASSGTLTITDGKVTTAKIADANVTEGKIAANAVTSAKIKDANVTTAKIADKNVTTGKIADAAVTPAKTSGVVGYIPSGSATATTYAQIWVQ